jgi:NAD(P)-dependent dehydrogenase (short-subunit alcohol dehydrogenase family)
MPIAHPNPLASRPTNESEKPVQRQTENDLTGKVVIITGASRGMGRQAALDFAKRGANVVIAARTVHPDETLPGTLGEALRQIEEMGVGALAVPTDLADQDDLKRLVDATIDRFGGVDVLVNNAAATVGDMWNKHFMDLTLDEWRYQFDVNTHAPFTLMQLVVPSMQSRGGGRIVNITTGSGEALRLPEEPVAPQSANGRNLAVPGYFASKRALDRLANVIAPELAAKNIYVITMHPGWVATKIVEKRLESVPDDQLNGRPVPMTTPARMMVYFAACANPAEYTGRVFWAEREMADMGIKAGHS